MRTSGLVSGATGSCFGLASFALVVAVASCATPSQRTRAAAAPGAASSERGMNPPVIVTPPVTPEDDPQNVERRYGFAEAKARRERDARRAAANRGAAQTSLEPVVGNQVLPPLAAPPPAPLSPGATAPVVAHDHEHSGAGPGGAMAGHLCPCQASGAKPESDSSR